MSALAALVVSSKRREYTEVELVGPSPTMEPAAPGTQRFAIRLEPRYRLLLRFLFGVRPENAYADLGAALDARFGWSRITTPVSNCVRWSIEGPWLALTAIGVRRGIRDGVISFGGTARGGVRVDFGQPVRYFFFRPRAVYLTVEDPEGFAAALARRGIPGEDRRRQISG